jgi:hypothetical protein
MCDCATEVDKQLAERECNTRLAFAMQITKDMGIRYCLLVGVEKIDKSKRKPAMLVTATFCPFCGKKFEQEAI